MVVAAMLYGIVATVGGCSRAVGISFSTSRVDLFVGDERDLFPYAVFDPPTSDEKSFSLSVDGDCVVAEGTIIKAVATGTAVVTATASGGTATVAVTVSYREASRLVVTADGALVQNVASGDAPTAVEFSAALGDGVDPSVRIEWTVNGSVVGAGRFFTYVPPTYGEYRVTAKSNGLESSCCIKIYRATTAVAVYSGELNQLRSFSPVRFEVRETIDTRNPRSTVEWFVNGESRSSSRIFEFTPSFSGEYEIEMTVNGIAREFVYGSIASPAVTVTAIGDRAPAVADVVFDDTDGVFITWADGGSIRNVSVTAPDGTRTNCNRTDVKYSHLFEQGSFNATELIEVCADDPGEYTIRLTAETQGEPYTFLQYEAAASEFIDGKVFINNSFISSAGQASDFVSELYACGITTARAYIARGLSADDIAETIKLTAAGLGLDAATDRNGNVITVTFDEYNNKPTSGTESGAAQMYSTLPHIEYDSKKLRSSAYALAVDRIKRSVEVTESEQLVYAVIKGFRPITAARSNADSIYSRARSVLLSIIGADYTDEQKVHAVHDYLQWSTRRVNDDDVKPTDASRFIESVFGGFGSAPSGAVASSGAAKAFALLCGMEGIENKLCMCARDGATYFRNKVKLDGLWYNVDVYGGEISARELGIAGNAELCSHRALLVSDRTAELYGGPTCDGGPLAYDESATYYTGKTYYDGVYCDYHIAATERDDYATIKAAVFAAFDGRTAGLVSIYGVNGKVSFYDSVCGAEFSIDRAIQKSEIAEITAFAKRAVVEFGEYVGAAFNAGSVTVYVTDGIMNIIVAIS